MMAPPRLALGALLSMFWLACDAAPETAPACALDRDCQDGDLCNGPEACLSGRCVASTPADLAVCRPASTCDAPCADDERCTPSACEPVCMPPQVPVLSHLPVGATLAFPEGAIALLDGLPASLTDARTVHVAHPGRLAIEARWSEPEPGCEATVFRATIDAIDAPPTDPASAPDAIAFDDPRLSAWAAGWAAPAWGMDLAPEWQDLTRALGPATGHWDDAVSLGNGGAITLIFETPVADAAGPDLAVFENGFSDQFLELAWVEVSSDGLHFARFASLSTQDASVGAYGTLDPREVMGVAGRFRGGYGTTFDLATLAETEAVLTGRVDLSAITHVRVVDIVGDGDAADSFGHPIFDPTPTYASAGFDLEAIGAIGH